MNPLSDHKTRHQYFIKLDKAKAERTKRALFGLFIVAYFVIGGIIIAF